MLVYIKCTANYLTPREWLMKSLTVSTNISTCTLVVTVASHILAISVTFMMMGLDSWLTPRLCFLCSSNIVCCRRDIWDRHDSKGVDPVLVTALKERNIYMYISEINMQVYLQHQLSAYLTVYQIRSTEANIAF